MLASSFRFCPYCARPLDTAEAPNLGTDHVQCSACDRCLTCEERAARGWKRNHPA